MAHTKEKLTAMKFTELRGIAKDLKINPAGKGQAQLVREILKKQAMSEGKGTAADPKPKGAVKGAATATATAKPKAPPADEDDEEEEEDDAPPPKKAAKTEPAEKPLTRADVEAMIKTALSAVEDLAGDVAALVGALNEARAEVGLDPIGAGKPVVKGHKGVLNAAKGAKAPPAVDEDDEEEEEEEEEEEDDAPPPKKGKAKAPTAEDDEEEEEEEEDEPEDDDEEEGEVLDISAEELASANLDRLQEIAETINEAAGEVAIEYDGVKSPRILRDSIREYLAKNAEKVVEDEPVSKGKSKKASSVPEHIRVGAKVRTEIEGEGMQNGVVSAIDEDEETATLDFDDDTEAIVAFGDILPRAKPKARLGLSDLVQPTTSVVGCAGRFSPTQGDHNGCEERQGAEVRHDGDRRFPGERRDVEAGGERGEGGALGGHRRGVGGGGQDGQRPLRVRRPLEGHRLEGGRRVGPARSDFRSLTEYREASVVFRETEQWTRIPKQSCSVVTARSGRRRMTSSPSWTKSSTSSSTWLRPKRTLSVRGTSRRRRTRSPSRGSRLSGPREVSS
jgi:hypothetical protein